MNKMTIAKWFSAFALIVAGVGSASAQKLSVNDLSLSGGDTKELTITIATEGKTVYGFQTDIVLPEGFTVAEEAEVVEGTMTDGAEAKGEPDYQISNVTGSTYRVLVYSGKGYTFDAKASKVLTVSVTAAGSFAEDDKLTLTNTRFALDNKGGEVKADDVTAKVITFIAPNGPTPKFSAMATDGETVQYLYNVEAKAFLLGANNWGTRASLSREAGYKVIMKAKEDGSYSFTDYAESKNSWNELDCQSGDQVWVDGAGRPGSGMWQVNDLGDNKYEISNTNVKGKFGSAHGSTRYDNRLYMSEDADLGATWAFVSEDDYKDYVDVYKKWKENVVPTLKSSKEPGTDITPALEGISSDMKGWTIDNGSVFHLNTWSPEGATDGSYMGYPFLENWVAAGSLLPEGTWSYTIEGLVAGQEYTVSAAIRAYNEGSTDAPEGACLYANDAQSKDISTGTNVVSGSKALVFGIYSVTAKADADGKLKIGIVEKENNFNWIVMRGIEVKVYDPSNPFQEYIDQIEALVTEALDLIDNNIVSEESKVVLKDAVKASRNIEANEEAYKAAIATLTEAIAAAKEDIAGDAETLKADAIAALETLPVGYGYFQYSPEAIAAAKKAIEAAQSAEEIAAAKPAPTLPAGASKLYLTTSEGTFEMAVSADGITIAEEGTPVKFVAQEDGTYAIANEEGEYVAYKGTNNWDMTASSEAYGWTISFDGNGYSIKGGKGLLGTNTSDGNGADAPLYGDKKVENGNVVWAFPSQVEDVAKLDAMKDFVELTNVYTEEAYNEYYGKWAAKYAAGTLTAAEYATLQDPTALTGWHASLTVDNFLLSAWDTNPDFTDAPYYINSWSVEGDGDANEAGEKSDFHVPFFEYFAGDPNSLAAKTLTATVEGLEAGEYTVKARARVRLKDGEDSTLDAPAKGITFQVNDGEAVNAADGEHYVFNTTHHFYIKEVVAKGNVAADGKLEIKFIIAEDNNVSWLSYKDVYYMDAAQAVGIETVTEASVAAPANKKLFENGKIVIIKNGKKFNVAGVEIK